MAFRLIPREEKFYGDFQALAEQIGVGARLLEEMLAPDHPVWDKAEEIKEVEHKCDFLTHEIIQRLNRTFVTPLDREDIYALAKSLDDVMDAIDASATLIRLYKLQTVRTGVREMAQTITASIKEIRLALDALAQHKAVITNAVEINRLENEADREHPSHALRALRIVHDGKGGGADDRGDDEARGHRREQHDQNAPISRLLGNAGGERDDEPQSPLPQGLWKEVSHPERSPLVRRAQLPRERTDEKQEGESRGGDGNRSGIQPRPRPDRHSLRASDEKRECKKEDLHDQRAGENVRLTRRRSTSPTGDNRLTAHGANRHHDQHEEHEHRRLEVESEGCLRRELNSGDHV